MSNKRTVLFVCTGNVCRSPMAAGLFYDHLIQASDGDRIRVRSAGLWALEGQPASAYACQVMAERNLDISAHRGRSLTAKDVDEADLILVMTHRHADIISRDFGPNEGKLHMLAEMAGDPYDIDDPYGGSLADYRATANELEELIGRGYRRIIGLLDQ